MTVNIVGLLPSPKSYSFTCEELTGNGNTVVVTRPDGTRVRYAHLSDLSAKLNQTVTNDTVYGSSGSTGKSTGEHLHYEVLGRETRPTGAAPTGTTPGAGAPR